MKRKVVLIICIIIIALLAVGYFVRYGQLTDKDGKNQKIMTTEMAASSKNIKEVREASVLEVGKEKQKGFINNNVLHSDIGDIHFSSYIPDAYDGSESYALFITLPGWEGLYFQGVGANMVEDFGTEAIKYNDKMIILSTQLDDWGETSADMVIKLAEYVLENYNIDSSKVYLEGYSGGGETGSLVMGKRPDLYTAFLMVSSKWDGDLKILAESKTPVYMVTGEEDSYYGSEPLKSAYDELYGLYFEQDLSDDEIRNLVVLDVKDASYFSERNIKDQHAGGGYFAYEEDIMGWLFGDY